MSKFMFLPLLLLVMIIIGCNNQDQNQQAISDNQNIFEVVHSNIIATIEEEGEIAPLKSVEVKPNISGRVLNVFVNEGDYVEEGQIVAQIVADREQTRSINSIINNYLEAEINFENAQEDYEYAQDLYDNNFISEREFRNAHNSFRVAEMRYNSTKEEYQLALREIDLNGIDSEKTSAVVSPLTGIVLQRFIEAGELVSGETSTRSGTVLFNIADYTSFIVKVEINEFDIDRVGAGQNVVITRGRTGEESYNGRVFKISPLAIQSDGVRVYPVEIEIENEKQNLRFGMTAAVRIITARANQALTIPVTALFVDDRGQEYVMLRQDDESFQQQYVHRGINNIFFVEIIDGLNDGDYVLNKGGTTTASGQRGSSINIPGMPTHGTGHRR